MPWRQDWIEPLRISVPSTCALPMRGAWETRLLPVVVFPVVARAVVPVHLRFVLQADVQAAALHRRVGAQVQRAAHLLARHKHALG